MCLICPLAFEVTLVGNVAKTISLVASVPGQVDLELASKTSRELQLVAELKLGQC